MAQVHGLGLGEQHVVVHLVDALLGTGGRGVDAQHGTGGQRHHVLLVDGQPVLDAVTITLEHELGELHEGIDRGAVGPATLLVKRGGKVEVIHGHQRLDVVLEALVDEVGVVLHAFLVDLAGALGQQARPADGEAIGLEAHLRHQGDVLLVMVILVGGDLKAAGACRRLLDVLYGRALAVGEGGTLNLVCGGGGAPEELVGEGLECLV